MNLLDKWKMVYGYTLLVALCVLGGLVAWGKVEQATSHGLAEIITVLSLLSAGFAHWAFGRYKETKDAGE